MDLFALFVRSVSTGAYVKRLCYLVTKKGDAQVTDEHTHRLRRSVCANVEMLLEDIQQLCLHMRSV